MDVIFVLYARNLPLDGRRGSPCAPVGLIHEIRAVLRGLISELPPNPSESDIRVLTAGFVA